MCSTPPARTTSAAPIAISPAPAVTAVSAPAHMRSTANPGHGLRQPGEERDVAPERQPLVADLRGGRHHDVADPLGRELRVAPQQLADDLDADVVGARPPEDPLRAGAPEGRPDAVDEHDLAQLTPHARSLALRRSPALWTNRHTYGTDPSPMHAPFPDTIAAGRRSGVPETEAPPGTRGEGGVDWAAHLAREEGRYRDGEARLASEAAEDDSDPRQRQLTRVGNAAGGAGLALLMLGGRERAAEWFARAAARYRESFADAPPGSWGRPIGAVKALVLADDWAGRGGGRRLGGGERAPRSPTLRSAATQPRLPCSCWAATRRPAVHADAIRIRDDFPDDVGDALAFIAAQDVIGYTVAIEEVLDSFEARDEYLEDLPVADTVLVLQALAARRGMAAELSSPLLPGR